MATLALAAAGAAIGESLGLGIAALGLSGGAVGWTVGSMIGNALFRPDLPAIEGPRITDRSIQTSAYGQAIPICYGTVRVAGNLIWASAIREARHEEEVGGKGGPSQTVVSYTYDVDLAVALCQGEIISVRKIWADGRLVWDGSTTASAATLVASSDIARDIRIYVGSATQARDPTIEAAEGTTSTPAYRDVAYLVFAGMQIGQFGNRIPAISAEVVASGTVTPYRRALSYASLSYKYKYGVVATPEYSYPYPVLHSVTGSVRIANSADTDVRVYDLTGAIVGREPATQEESEWPVFTSDPPVTRLWDGLRCYATVGIISGAGSLYGQASSDTTSGKIDFTAELDQSRYLHAVIPCVDQEHLLVITSPSAITDTDQWDLLRWDGTAMTLVDTGTAPAGLDVNTTGMGRTAVISTGYGCGCGESNLTHWWVAYGAGNFTVHIYEIDSAGTMSTLETFDGPSGDGIHDSGTFTRPSIWADRGIAWIVAGGAIYSHTRIPSTSITGDTLSTVVGDILERAGITSGYRTLTALTDTCDGYVIGRIMSARAAIEPLQKAYWFDMVETEGKLKAVMRGGASAATITTDDMLPISGAGPLAVNRILLNEELPGQLTVSYFNRSNDYQIGTQRAKRISSNLLHLVDESLAIVLSDSRASQVADVLLYDAWTGRIKLSFGTNLDYAELEPTDVVTIDDGTAEITGRIVSQAIDGTSMRWEVVSDSASVYTPNSSAATAGAVADTLSPKMDTQMVVLDAPVLRDQDDGLCLYIAANGYSSSSWGGTQVFVSRDNASWQEAGTITSGAVIGVADSALGNFSGGHVFDELNTLTVTVTGGTLANATADEVLAGTNAAWIGGELIGFKTATLVSGTQYTLTGLLRGLVGTERLMSGHAIGDRFVMLSPSGMLRIAQSTADIDATRWWRGVTFGRRLSSARSIETTFEGVSLKPIPPVFQTAFVAASGDITISWVRRARVGATWRDSVDVPLDESSESYEIDILDGTGAVVRTLSSTSSSVTYTSAQIATDFTTPPVPFEFNVYQMSAVVGRGFPAFGSVTLSGDYAGSVLADSPLGYWRMSDTSGTTCTDASGNGRNGTYTGSPTLAVGGRIPGNAAVTFDGTNDYVDISSTAFDVIGGASQSFTIECWFKSSTASTPVAIIDKTNITASARWVLLQLVSNKAHFQLYDGSANPQATGGPDINDGNWHHIAAVRDVSLNQILLYVDGTLITTASATGTTDFSTTRNLCIAARQEGTDRFVSATIDEVAVYSTALSATRIAAHYSQA